MIPSRPCPGTQIAWATRFVIDAFDQGQATGTPVILSGASSTAAADQSAALQVRYPVRMRAVRLLLT